MNQTNRDPDDFPEVQRRDAEAPKCACGRPKGDHTEKPAYIGAPWHPYTVRTGRHERGCLVISGPHDAALCNGLWEDVVSPPTDRAALRDRIAAKARTVRLRLGPNALAMAQRGEPIILNLNEADDLADAVLAVLPEPTDRGAVLREAIDVAREEGHRLEEQVSIEAARGARCVAYLLRKLLAKEGPRRLAVEAQPCRWEHPHPGYRCEPRPAVEAHDTGTPQPEAVPASRLSGQHADALWDAIAPPGPDRPSYPVQHERVCRVVADIVNDVAAGAGAQQPHTAAPTADRPAVLREIATTLDQLAETDVIRKRRSLATARRLLAVELRRMADDAPAPVAQQPAALVRPGDATVDPAMCPRCKGDNSEAFELCTACAQAEQQAAAADGEETRR